MADLVVGNVVALNSNGPAMTVRRITDDKLRVSCLWFAGVDLRSAEFEIETLRLFDDQEIASLSAGATTA